MLNSMSSTLGDNKVIPSLEFKSPSKVSKPFGSALPRFRYYQEGGNAEKRGAQQETEEDGSAEWKPDGTYSQVHDAFIVKKKALKDTIDLIKEMDARR